MNKKENPMDEQELIKKTPEAKVAHQEFIKRCAEDLELLEKCRLTELEIIDAVAEGQILFANLSNEERDNTTEDWQISFSLREAQLAQAIPLISAQARKQERERVKIDYQTFIDFACNVANHFDECRDSRIGFIMQQAFGDIEWEEAQDIINTVISQGQALKEGGKEAE